MVEVRDKAAQAQGELGPRGTTNRLCPKLQVGIQVGHTEINKPLLTSAFFQPIEKLLPLQVKAVHQYAKRRSWKVVKTVEDVGSGADARPQREELIKAARRRQIDAVLVWRLDRWGRSLLDLIGSLQELSTLGVGCVSLCEALDLTTPSGRALAGMLAVFAEFEREILRDRVKAGIAQARQQGKPHGRPPTINAHSAEIKRLFAKGISKREIAKRLTKDRSHVCPTSSYAKGSSSLAYFISPFVKRPQIGQKATYEAGVDFS